MSDRLLLAAAFVLALAAAAIVWPVDVTAFAAARRSWDTQGAR